MDNKAFMNSSSDLTMTASEVTASSGTNGTAINGRSGMAIHITADDLYASDKTANERPDITQSICKSVSERFRCKKLIPILDWLPRYQLGYLKEDMVAAITVAIMHVPQGLAYGELAGVDAINGLYVSTFPPLIYALLGTSRHVSIGTFAVVSLLVRSALTEISSQVVATSNGTVVTLADTYLHNELAITLAASVGILQFVMGILGLGSLSVLFSEPMLSGFTTGAAMHVVASQLRALFDMKVERRNGLFKAIMTFYDVLVHIAEVNYMTTIISLTAMVVIYAGQNLNERYKAKLFMPVPIELIIVMIVTAISYGCGLNVNYGVVIMGDVPAGAPTIDFPKLTLFPNMLSHALLIAFISYVILLSLGKTFARRNGYTVDANQEFMAMGCANIFGSFLDCYPCAASLSRSSLQEKAGCKSHLTTIFSSAMLLIVIFFAGPLFYHLPKSILSSIIIVALKGMLLQVFDCIRYSKVSFIESTIWLSTFLACFIFDLDYGIMAGTAATVAALLYRDSKPRVRRVAPSQYGSTIHDTDGALLLPITILRVESEVNFINRDAFKDEIKTIVFGEGSPTETKGGVVFDLSGCSFVDCSGCTTVKEIITILTKFGLTVCIVGAEEHVRIALQDDENDRLGFAPSLNDANFVLSDTKIKDRF